MTKLTYEQQTARLANANMIAMIGKPSLDTSVAGILKAAQFVRESRNTFTDTELIVHGYIQTPGAHLTLSFCELNDSLPEFTTQEHYDRLPARIRMCFADKAEDVSGIDLAIHPKLAK